ncbi:MAG: hypothetical protein ACXWNK_09945 [Vulcanimicrobiaceae bacterium]
MTIPYRYLVRTMRGAAEIEVQLSKLSQDGWEPINFARDATGTYEVILRKLGDEGGRVDAMLEELEVTSEMIAPAPDLS